MSDRTTELISVEVTYASKSRQSLKSLNVPRGTKVIEAIQLSGICDEFPELNIETARIGIFSQFVEKEQVLNEHDRVEIYRPLLIDPKEARRQRARIQR